MPTIIFFDANNGNHVTLKICLLRVQYNLHDMLCISPTEKYLSEHKIDCPMDPIDPSDHLTFAMLADPLASRQCSPTLCNYVISPSVKYLFDRKIACPMDPIDPSDHLTFAMLVNPLASRLHSLALWNYVISPLVKYLSDRKIACPIDPLDIRHEQLKKKIDT